MCGLGDAQPSTRSPMSDETPDTKLASATLESQLRLSSIAEEEDEMDSPRWSIAPAYYLPFRPPKLGYSLPARVFRKFPRTFSFFCGIIIPLWLLVLLSFLCGKILAELESGGELEAIDNAMRNRAMMRIFNERTREVTTILPKLCILVHRNGTALSSVSDAYQHILDTHDSFAHYVAAEESSLVGGFTIDMNNYASYLNECGRAMDDLMDGFQRDWFGNVSLKHDVPTDVTFHWNRCVNRSSPAAFNRIFSPTWEDVQDAHPDEQERLYETVWNKNRDELRDSYIERFVAENMTIIDARLLALNTSMNEATAREHCAVNVAGAGMFWFSVMTTVGYGNQAVVSVGGRAMVYTIGFVCILFFGSVLATSGTIISHLVHDLLRRLKSRILVKNQVMMLVWGILWCGWMALISSIFVGWADARLNVTISWGDAYWFSFISTTTVGLGDVYPTPAMLFLSDLLAVSLSFLFGFVLLSAFLSELHQLIAKQLPDLSMELGRRLKIVGATTSDGVLGGKREPHSFFLSQTNDDSA